MTFIIIGKLWGIKMKEVIYYANYDDQCNLVGYYNSLDCTNIPTPNLELSRSEWQHALEINANVVIHGQLKYFPLIKSEESKVKSSNTEIKSRASELNKYETIPALIDDAEEYEQYKVDLNKAISSQSRNKLVLPKKPSWFI